MYKKCGVRGTTGWGDYGQETLDIAVPFFVKNSQFLQNITTKN